MIWIIIAILIGFGIGWVDEEYQRRDKGEKICCGLFLAFVGGIVGVLIGLMVGTFLPAARVVETSQTLHNIKDHSGVTGSFFLGCGRVDSDVRYYYYTKTKDGRLWPQNLKVSPGRVAISEQDGVEPTLKVYSNTEKHSWTVWFGFVSAGERHYEFTLPKNTVFTDFRLGGVEKD